MYPNNTFVKSLFYRLMGMVDERKIRASPRGNRRENIPGTPEGRMEFL
jgi:hypothetical protein